MHFKLIAKAGGEVEAEWRENGLRFYCSYYDDGEQGRQSISLRTSQSPRDQSA